MRIRRIRIENFRNLREVEVYPQKTTIFVGENNTGKSNLLFALRLILDPNARRLETELSEDDINDVALSGGTDYFSVTMEIGDLQKHQEIEAIFRDRIDLDGDESFVTLKGTYEKDEDGVYEWKVLVLAPKGRHNEPVSPPRTMVRYVPLYYLDAVRDARRDIRATGRGALSQLLQDVSLADVEGDIIKNIQEANMALSKNADIENLSKSVTGLLSPQIPGGKGEVSLTVATEDPTQLLKGLRLNLKRESDLRTHEMARHGTGLQNLVLVAMFRHMISSVKAIQPILAIEEPDAHLHPQAQRCLYKDLEKIDSPVLLTTHSPAIAECASPLGLVRLAFDNQNQVMASQLDSSRINENDLKSLSRMMRSGRAEAFFARAIVVVEGLSEVIALPAFAEQMGYDLNRDCISLVPANGNAFSFILISCNEDHFAIPTLVVFDSDALQITSDLVKEACKAGLIGTDVQNECAGKSAEHRRGVLENVGWIPAHLNFEEEIAKAGYLPQVLNVIDELGATRSLEEYLSRRRYSKDPQGVAMFLNSTRSGKGLKVPIAREVANEVKNIGQIPNCYSECIKRATTLAAGGVAGT
jgi:putative ATP-dependent endonuclease of OLD family